MGAFAKLMFWLIVSHAVADFPLQPDSMAVGKDRHHDPALHGVDWWYWLTSHAIVQGAGVALVTQSISLGLAEMVAHWLIDFGKIERRYGIHVDQALHIACKFVWAWIYIGVMNSTPVF
jgi:Protein of unknown function (DUF3307)